MATLNSGRRIKNYALTEKHSDRMVYCGFPVRIALWARAKISNPSDLRIIMRRRLSHQRPLIVRKFVIKGIEFAYRLLTD